MIIYPPKQGNVNHTQIEQQDFRACSSHHAVPPSQISSVLATSDVSGSYLTFVLDAVVQLPCTAGSKHMFIETVKNCAIELYLLSHCCCIL